MNRIIVGIRNCALFSLLLLIGYVASAQHDEKGIDKFSLNPKISWYNMLGDKAGFVAGGEFSLLSSEMIYTVDYYGFEEFTIWSPVPPEGYNQVGLMVGKFRGDRIRHKYQAGLAAFWGHKTIENGTHARSDDFITAGLTGRYGIEFILIPYVSVGADLQVNLNLKKSIYMPMFSIGIGKLRNR